MKQTKEGLEVKLHPKDKALELVGRHLGMWKDKLAVGGDGDAPPVKTETSFTGTPLDAYMRVLGKG